MTSASSTFSTSTDAARLSVKPDAPTTGFVDGAWWPASRDLAAELTDRLGPIQSVSYSIGAWEPVPRKITIGTSAVRMAGYRTQDHDPVDVIGDRRRLTLRVVPPETDPRAAHDALAAASGVGNTDNVTTLLRAGAAQS